MTKFYEYNMTISDAEYCDTYNFTAYFTDHFEADRFLTENENAGNSIIINSINEKIINPAELPMA